MNTNFTEKNYFLDSKFSLRTMYWKILQRISKNKTVYFVLVLNR